MVSPEHDMSGLAGHIMSGLQGAPMGVTDATDRDTTGDPEDWLLRLPSVVSIANIGSVLIFQAGMEERL
jgi:hypothetical protein